MWDYESYWQKTKLYMTRALNEDRTGPMFPFWSALALEFLARATLSRIHPVLVADPQEGENILFAFGFGTAKNPKTVPASTVLKRCKAIITEFTDEEVKKCLFLINRRNQELHSGTPGFEDLTTQVWLADFFRISALLLQFQGKTLEDLLGPEETIAANKMIEASTSAKKDEINALVGMSKGAFLKLIPEERAFQISRAALSIQLNKSQLVKRVNCPACGTEGLIHGERIRVSQPQALGEHLVRKVIVLPTAFNCIACGLKLSGHNALHVAELGGQYNVDYSYEPEDEYDDEDELEDDEPWENDDYGND